MNKSEQYDFFKKLIKTNESLEKALKDKTTDEIVSDITDPDATAAVIPKQGRPSESKVMQKGSKGVWPQSSFKLDKPGVSSIGSLVREGNEIKEGSESGPNQEKRHTVGQNAIEGAKRFHKEKIAEMKGMKKPDLPKSEEFSKTDKSPSESSINKFKRFMKKKKKK